MRRVENDVSNNASGILFSRHVALNATCADEVGRLSETKSGGNRTKVDMRVAGQVYGFRADRQLWW